MTWTNIQKIILLPAAMGMFTGCKLIGWCKDSFREFWKKYWAYEDN